MRHAVEIASSWILIALLVGIPLYGWVKGVKVYEAFVEGAKEGFNVAVRIIPFLVAILAAVGQAGTAEPGELDTLLRPVGADALLDLRAGHVQHAARELRVVGEPSGVELLLGLRQLAHRLLGGEDARARGLVPAALAGGREEQGGGEEEVPHGARTLTEDGG